MSLCRRVARYDGTFLDVSMEDRQKICFQSILIAMVSFGFGWLVCFFWSNELCSSIEQAISIHFEIPFHYTRTVQGSLLLMLRFAGSDLMALAVLFLFSFTVLNVPVTQVLLWLKSGCFGIAFGLLCHAHSHAVFPPKISQVCLFTLFRLAILGILIYYGVCTAIFSEGLRRCAVAPFRVRIPKKQWLVFLLQTGTVFGSVLLMTMVYCGFLWVL